MKLLLAGDAVELPCPCVPAGCDLDKWVNSLVRWREHAGAHSIIPSHGPSGGKEILDRAKRRIITKRIYAHDQVEKQASELGELESIGLPWSTLDTQARSVLALTASDIQQLARTYLTENRYSAAYLPGPEKKHD